MMKKELNNVEQERRLEVIDANNMPLLFMPHSQVIQQKLPHKAVLVVLRNKENRVYIHKRSESKHDANLWRASTSGTILAGEAALEAAARILHDKLGVSGVTLRELGSTSPAEETGNRHITLFLSAPSLFAVTPQPQKKTTGMFIDQDELNGMRTSMPELLSPSLIWAASHFDLFG